MLSHRGRHCHHYHHLFIRLFLLPFQLLDQPHDMTNTVIDSGHVSNSSTASNLPEQQKKHKRCKKVALDSDFLDMNLIEELDADTGEVRCLHSLFSDDVTPSAKQNLMKQPDALNSMTRTNGSIPAPRVYGLILLPTRELALQVG